MTNNNNNHYHIETNLHTLIGIMVIFVPPIFIIYLPLNFLFDLMSKFWCMGSLSIQYDDRDQE